ncbi:MAG: FAD-dependent oxidoreductase [Candidatus Woesearchaeota archaeon]|nr:FAD-dependent oxidoreductase [Candidatus Woesearchaeota archaeon]
MTLIDVAIVGGGIGGLCTATALVERGYENIAVFEKERNSFEGQSGHNSGVIHSGAYYEPGSLKARLCVEGNRRMYETCARYSVAHRRTGKLVVATRTDQFGALEELSKTARENGVSGSIDGEKMRMLTADEIQEYEPNIRAKAALYVPSTGIFDAVEYCTKMKQRAEKDEKTVFYGAEVMNIEAHDNWFNLRIQYRDGTTDTVRSRFLVNAAGVHADDIGRMIHPEFPYTFVPQRGEYFSFRSGKRPELHMKGHCVYPVPLLADDGKMVSLGIHLTPTFDGDKMLVGPTATLIQDKKKDTQEFEPRSLFFERVQPFLPGLQEEDLAQDQFGITMRIFTLPYNRVTDFVIEPDHYFPHAIHMIMPSPGFTSAEPAGEYTADLVDEMNK